VTGAEGSRLTRLDVRILIALTAVAFLLRLLSPIMPDFVTHPLSWPPVRMEGLGHPYQSPNGYIFDEVYFAQDACRDIKGMDYLDPEPPLAKLAIAGGILVSGLWMHYDRGATGVADKPCEAQGTLPGFGTWGWRLTSLVFGTLLVPLVFLLALRLWPSRFFATSAAVLMNLDGMPFVQSRIAMIDVVAIFLILLAYWVFLVHRQAKDDSSFHRTGLLLGLTIGLAVSAKWVALAAWGTMIFFLGAGWLLRYIRLGGPGSWALGGEPERRASAAPAGDDRDPFADELMHTIRRAGFYALVFLVIPVLVYLLSYARYTSITHNVPVQSYSNPCDANKGTSVTTLPASLATSGPLAAIPSPVEYVRQVFLHDRWSYYYHSCLTATHNYGSPWFSWPFLARPVAYYYQDNVGFDSLGHQPTREEVFNLGNPAIWWFSIPCLIYCVAVAVRERNFTAAFIVVAFLTSWLPFARVSRVLFLYHMFGGLTFMMLAAAFALARMRRSSLRLELGGIRSPALTGTHLALAYLGLVVVTFIYFYPLWTGLPLTGDDWTQRIWFQLPDLKINWI
jgi:dolichyl-phosphate-mannose-protein mannosyltransferase